MIPSVTLFSVYAIIPVLYPLLTGPNTRMTDISRALLGDTPFSTSSFSCKRTGRDIIRGYALSSAAEARRTASVSIVSREPAMSRSCPDTCTTTLTLGRPNSEEGTKRRSTTRPILSRTGSTPNIQNTCASVAPSVVINSPAQKRVAYFSWILSVVILTIGFQCGFCQSFAFFP